MRAKKKRNSHGLVSLQFLCALGIFFGVHKSIPKSAITELYKSLSYETLSGARDFYFQAVSDLISEVSFQIKHSTPLNGKRKEEDNESNLKIKEDDFFERRDQFLEEVVEDLFKNRKKTEHPYVEPQVQVAEIIDIETKKEDDEFFDLEKKISVIGNAATEQKKKKKNDLIDLVDDMLHENNPFNDQINTKGKYIKVNLFDDTDSKDIKKRF